MRSIAREVERLCRLEFRRLPKPEYVLQKEMTRRIQAEIDEAPAAEIEAAERALIALATIPKGTDLMKLVRTELAADVAGYYDQRTHALVVLGDATRSLDAWERIILAHELEHALADQRLGLPGGDDRETPDGAEDQELARAALVEGDSTLLMEAFAVANVSPGAFGSLGSLGSLGSSTQLPHYIEASEMFAYLEGQKFVCRLYRRGGWAAVDRAYRKLPASTAQILFPQRYIEGERPVDTPALGSPGRGWKRLDRTAVGAADLLWLFEAPGNERSRALTTPRRRAAAWAGGQAAIWTRGPRTTLTLVLAERRGARPRLCASMRAWARAARRPAGAITCSGRLVRASLRA